MKSYKGPKTYTELSCWHAKRSPLKGERTGQAFFNDFDYQYKNSYDSDDLYEAFSLICDGLSEEFPNFWG